MLVKLVLLITGHDCLTKADKLCRADGPPGAIGLGSDHDVICGGCVCDADIQSSKQGMCAGACARALSQINLHPYHEQADNILAHPGGCMAKKPNYQRCQVALYLP